MIICILLFLPSDDILSFGATCKEFYCISNIDYIWRELATRRTKRFSNMIHTLRAFGYMSWKDVVMNYYLQNLRFLQEE
jgi:hypothetical protein